MITGSLVHEKKIFVHGGKHHQMIHPITYVELKAECEGHVPQA